MDIAPCLMPPRSYQGQALPVGSQGRLSSGWWGMWTLIATEAALFAYLLFSYFYVGAQSRAVAGRRTARRRSTLAVAGHGDPAASAA